ncbi:MAG: hypothetical protein ABR505_12300 [Actinomycetota bacterium]
MNVVTWTQPANSAEEPPRHQLSRLARFLGWTGVIVGAAIASALTAICTFNGGALDPEWAECLFPITLAVIPHATALLGLLRQEWGLFLLTLAGVITIAFGFFAFLIVAMLPALFYLGAAVAGQRSGRSAARRAEP